MKPAIFLAAVGLAAVGQPSFAQVTVTDAWARATVPGQTGTGAFMRVTSAKDAKLVEVRSAAAATVELHEMSMSNGVMSMRQAPSLDLPAGRGVELKPGGYHVMLMGLKKPMKEGDTVPITLVVEGADKKRELVELAASVKALTARSGDASR